MSIIVKKFLKTNLLEKQHFNKHTERERKRLEYIYKSILDRKAYLCLSPTEQYILNDKSLDHSRQEQRIYDFKTPFDNDNCAEKKERSKEMTLTMALSSMKNSNQIQQRTMSKKRLTFLESIVFSPDGTIKILWDFLCMLLIFYEILSIPFRISFDFEISNDLSTFITTIFLIDIAITFNTAVWIKGTINYKYSVIFRQYMKLWFWLDLIASFPYDMIIESVLVTDTNETDQSTKNIESSKTLQQSAQILRLLKFFRFIKIIRLLRLAKLKVIFDKIEEQLQTYTTINTIASFLKLSFFVLFWSHWLGCIFHFVGMNEDPNHNWLVIAGIYDSPIEVRYVTSIYWAVTTMITVGYGDISPQTTTERFCGIFFLLVACGVLSFTMNSIGNTMQQMSQKKDQQKKNIAEINNYMQKVKIPKHLQQRVRKYLQYIWDSSRLIKLDAITINLSQELKQLLTVHVNGNILATYTNFCKTFSRVLLLDITQILFEQTAQPDEYIIIEDNPKNSHHLYFIQDGLINIVLPKTRQVVAKLTNKQIFGEINFFGNVGRTASAKSEGFSDLFVLKRDDFLQILQKYPKDFEKFYLIQEEVNKNQFQVLQIHCFACELPGHVVRDCPQLHFIVDLYVYNKTKNRCIRQIMKEYVRKDRIHFNAIKHQYLIKKEALSIQTVIPMIGFIIEECNLEDAQFKTIQFKSIPQPFKIKSKFKEDRSRRREIQKVMRAQQSQVQMINQKQNDIYNLTKSLSQLIQSSTPSLNLLSSSISHSKINENQSSDEQSDSQTIQQKLDEIILEYQVQKENQIQENLFIQNKSQQTYSLIDLFEFGFDFEIYNTHNNLTVVLKEVQKYYNGAQIKPKIDTEYDVNVFEEYLDYYAINMEDINRFKLEVKPERLKQFLPYTTLVEIKQSRQFKQNQGRIKNPLRQSEVSSSEHYSKRMWIS
ncbi:unnamed protein product [Paramecium pentaurelia]|uniref:Cyclic nucleotide-binding domain-containing protein n=1 Tax=Paramecium pentaurelia TaxID=43138 RepID=A0A8S1WFV0_9CILI|nr:unnamed protein product [Paramecium pentaurelia]